MSNRYKGGIISATAPTTSTSTAKGIWTNVQIAQAVGAGTWPRSPGAPTIGTATAVTFSTATVTFTAPTDVGSGGVTYTATSSPAGGSGTGTSPITVTGLSPLTSYTFTVTASTPGGTGPSSAASNSITTTAEPAPTVIGQAYGGGFYAGQISTSANGTATHYLVIADITVGQVFGKLWGPTGYISSTSTINGPANSATQAALGSTYECATFCENLNAGGYTDWYFPAKDELEVCYYFLKPTTASNITTSGSNPYAVSPEPQSTNYSTPTPPSQSSSAAFRSGGAQALTADTYLNSTQYSSTDSYQQTFSNGAQGPIGKDYGPYFFTRAVRRVPV